MAADIKGATGVKKAAAGAGHAVSARGLYFGAALAMFVASTLGALLQSPYPDPFKPVTGMDRLLYPFERNAFKRLPVITSYLNDLFVLPGTEQLWTVGDDGMIAHSDDGGKTWTRQVLSLDGPPDPGPPKQQLPVETDSYLGWPELVSTAQAAEQKGANLRTKPKQQTLGASEVRDREPPEQQFRESLPEPKNFGPDTTQRPPEQQPVTEADPREAPRLNSVWFADDRRGWAVGAILTTADGGANWVSQTSRTKAGLTCLHFLADGRRGWTAGLGGTILATTDGGANWAPQISGKSTRLASVQILADGQRGWAVGADGTILATSDGGANWEDPVTYARYSAPWTILGWFLCAGLLVRAGPWAREPKARETIADWLVSDRPLTAGERDVLGSHRIAVGLARFFRNRQTEPPVTLAIEGEWGSGKSSLMNLAKSELEAAGFRPVWFNAWHHQKEKHLLASLLENIRGQAIAPWWHPENWIFRGRLLAVRFGRHKPLLVVLLLLILGPLGYFVGIPEGQQEAAVEGVYRLGVAVNDKVVKLTGGWLKSDEKPVQPPNPQAEEKGKAAQPGKSNAKENLTGGDTQLGAKTTETAKPGSPEVAIPALAWLFALIPIWLAWRNRLTSLGLDPARLLAQVSGNARIRDLSAQLGFSHKFATEFRDVTEAMKPLTMVIFIDDLDRCAADDVVELLEAVNFLVTSGDCYVVMGIARERVVRCLAHAFRDVAEDLVDSSDETAKSSDAKRNSGNAEYAYAVDYLEKLINIEVPVPSMAPEKGVELLASEGPRDRKQPEKPGRWQQIVAALRSILNPARRKQLTWLLVIAGTLGIGYWSGTLVEDAPEQPGVVPAVVTGPTGSDAAPTEAPTTVEDSETRRPDQAQSPAEARFEPGQTAEKPIGWVSGAFLALATLFAGLMLWQWLRRQTAGITEPPEFGEALKLWYPVIAAHRSTPRSIKRFVNRLRFFSMQQTAEESEPTAWQRFRLRLGRAWGRIGSWLRQSAKAVTPPNGAEEGDSQSANEAEDVSGSETLPDVYLVALGAMYHCNPEWLDHESLFDPESVDWQQFVEEDDAGVPSTDSKKRLLETIAQHSRAFEKWPWPPSPEQRKRFRELMVGAKGA